MAQNRAGGLDPRQIPDRHGAGLARMVNQVADIFDAVPRARSATKDHAQSASRADNARDAIERSGGDKRQVSWALLVGHEDGRVATFAPDAANTAHHGPGTPRRISDWRRHLGTTVLPLAQQELKRMRALCYSSKGQARP